MGNVSRKSNAKMVELDEDIVPKCQKAIQKLLGEHKKQWVLFKNQTFVILQDVHESSESASSKATEIMKQFGPVYPGCPAGDFNVITVKDTSGWIVTGHCDSMFTYVDETQAKQEDGVMVIGLIGRGMRNQDGLNPEIIHIEL